MIGTQDGEQTAASAAVFTPQPSSSFQPDPSSNSDEAANREAFKLGSGEDLKGDSERREHRRTQKWRDSANWGTLLIFWVAVVVLVCGVLIYGWHLLAPIPWRWLEPDALKKLETILGAAVLSSALTQYASKKMA